MSDLREAANRPGSLLQTLRAVAWSFLGLTPGVNRDMGFSLAFHDKDSADGTPEAKLQWSFQSLGGKKARLGKLVLK